MKNEDIIRQRQANFRQTNAYAMQNGLILGVWTIASLACYVAGLTMPICSNLWLLLTLGIPVVTWYLTVRFRRIVGLDINFPFARGFMHAFLTLIYSAIWASVATYLYMRFFDEGYIFDCFAKNFSDPAIIKALQESGLDKQIEEATGGQSMMDIVNDLRTISAASWAAFVIYFHILFSPVISVVVGLLTMHRVHYNRG